MFWFFFWKQMQILLLSCWCQRHQLRGFMLEDKGHPTTFRPFCKNGTLKKSSYCEDGLHNILEIKNTSLCVCAYGIFVTTKVLRPELTKKNVIKTSLLTRQLSHRSVFCYSCPILKYQQVTLQEIVPISVLLFPTTWDKIPYFFCLFVFIVLVSVYHLTHVLSFI